MATAEETRAAAFREQECARARSLAARRLALAGDSSARAALSQKWAPITDPQPVLCEPVHTCDPPTNAD